MGDAVVLCPQTGTPAVVAVDIVRGVLTAYRRKPELRLAACSRWPERSGCPQDCLRQIEAAPERCLARTESIGS